MKNTVLKGSIILIVSALLCKVLGAIYRIPLSNILGVEGVGVYQMIFSVFSVALIIASGGVSVTVSHQVAKIRASGEGSEKAVFIQGVLYSLIVSGVFALIFICFGKHIATLQGNSLGGSGYLIAGLALVFASIISAYRGLYQGRQNMLPTAISQMIEQIFKLVFGLLFAFLFIKKGIENGVLGAFLGITISELLAFLFLLFTTKKTNFKVYSSVNSLGFWKTNIAVTVSGLVIPLVTALDSFLVVNILSRFYESGYATALYGLQSGIVTSLINFPVVVSLAVSLALLPNLSFLKQKGEINEVKKSLSNVYLALISVVFPCTIVFFVFSNEIFEILYPSINSDLLVIASSLLRLSALEIVMIAILQVSTTALQSLDKPKFVASIMAICGIGKVALTIILVSMPSVNIYGLAVSALLFYFVSALVMFLAVKKNVGFSIEKKPLVLCLTLTALLALVFLLINVYFQSVWVKIVYALVSMVLVYVLPLYLSNFLNIKNFFINAYKRTRQIE